MWKWTYPNEIKVIILDGDSLDKAYVEYKYEDNCAKFLKIEYNKGKCITNTRRILS